MSRQRFIFNSLLVGLFTLGVSCEDFDDSFGSGNDDRDERAGDVCSNNCNPYEAESYTGQSGCKKATNHTGYKGSGFVDFGANGTWIEWNKIAAPIAGEYTLTFRYANGSSGNRQAAILVNGQSVKNVPFSKTGGWKNWRTVTAKANLRQGNNTIRVKANTGSGGPNLDNMLVVGEGLNQDNCPNDPNKTEPGLCGCGVPEGSCNGVKNIALRKPATQSSTAYRGDPSRAVDGNTSGRYGDNSVTHTADESAPWWRVNLGAAYRVERVTLFNRTDCCSERLTDFYVELLDKNGGSITKKLHSGRAATKTDISVSGSGVYAVRVGLRRTNPLSLAEVQVFGSRDTVGGGLCAEAGEGKSATLSCPSGQTVSNIDFASYGEPSGSCSAGFRVGTCHASSSMSKVKSACLGKRSCSVSASNGTFGDPCGGTRKKLAISYQCSGGTGDLCPNDPNKTAPGICGCGTPDTDSDRDGTPNCKDNCPSDAKKTDPGKCGCGKAEGTCNVTGTGSFTLAILPDVQKLTKSNSDAEWLYKIGDFLIDNKNTYNLKAVASVGDLVQVATLPGTRNQTRWDRVLNFANDLDDEGLAFMPGCGNHDGCQDHYGHPLDYSAQFSDLSRTDGPDGSPRKYVLKRDNPYFEGSYSTVNSTHGVENAYYRIEYGGRAFVILSLRFGDSSEDSILTKTYNSWVRNVLEDNYDATAIIVTHWLSDSPVWVSSSNPVICNHDNVLMAVEGHSHGTRYRKVIDCGGGHKVERHQFSLPHGSNPLNEAAARLYTFDLDAGEVCYKSRHVYENKWLTSTAGCDPAKDGHCDQNCFDLPDR